MNLMRNIIILLNFFSVKGLKYYYHPDIHNFGNIGLRGRIHAELSPFFTKLIDNHAYNGKDIRSDILNKYSGKKIIDFCCGTGFSTQIGNTGIDTSSEMLDVAKKTHNNKNFYFGNAENYGADNQYDIVTCMFSFHEMPNYAHNLIIDNAVRVAKEEIIIVDISPNYNPSKMMISGEPYIIDYLNSIQDTLNDFSEFIYIDGHVTIWKKNLLK